MSVGALPALYSGPALPSGRLEGATGAEATDTADMERRTTSGWLVWAVEEAQLV